MVTVRRKLRCKTHRYKSQRSFPSFEFLVRDYSRLVYEDLSLDLKFVASKCTSGVPSDTVPRMCHTLHAPRGKERSHVDTRVTLLSRIGKNYHIMQIRARAQNTSGSA